jgi:hypothetical protein
MSPALNTVSWRTLSEITQFSNCILYRAIRIKIYCRTEPGSKSNWKLGSRFGSAKNGWIRSPAKVNIKGTVYMYLLYWHGMLLNILLRNSWDIKKIFFLLAPGEKFTNSCWFSWKLTKKSCQAQQQGTYSTSGFLKLFCECTSSFPNYLNLFELGIQENWNTVQN